MGLHVWLILIIHGVHVCKLAYFLKLICNPKICPHSTSVVICDKLMHTVAKHLSHAICMFPPEVK